jgi:hypothetical protein
VWPFLGIMAMDNSNFSRAAFLRYTFYRYK